MKLLAHAPQYLREIPIHGTTGDGRLSVLERPPFPVARMYWITDVGSPIKWQVKRGGHAHRECQQLFFCLRGHISITSTDGRRSLTQVIEGDIPHRGLYMPPMWWHDMTYKVGSICLALASHLYDEREYVRDRREFDQIAADGRKEERKEERP